MTLLLIVLQLSEGEVASIATFLPLLLYTHTHTHTRTHTPSLLPPPFRHVSLLPSPQQLKALEGDGWVGGAGC